MQIYHFYLEKKKNLAANIRPRKNNDNFLCLYWGGQVKQKSILS